MEALWAPPQGQCRVQPIPSGTPPGRALEGWPATSASTSPRGRLSNLMPKDPKDHSHKDVLSPPTDPLSQTPPPASLGRGRTPPWHESLRFHDQPKGSSQPKKAHPIVILQPCDHWEKQVCTRPTVSCASQVMQR